MKFALPLFLNLLILTSSWAAEVVDPSEGYVEDYGNDLGDRLGSIAGRGYNTLTRQSCERGSADELNGINCSGGYQYVGLNVPEDVRAIENMEEELIFLEAARRTHRFSLCQKGLHDRYIRDAEARNSLHQNAFEQFNQVRDHVRQLHGVITRETATIENVRQNFSYAEDRYNPAYYEAQRRRDASQGRRAEANQRLESLLSRMPLGNRPEMKAAMVELAAGGGEITKEAFDNAFAGAMSQLRNQTNQSLEFFRPLISTYVENGETKNLYRVDEDFKRDLINTGQIENVVNSLNMEQRYRDNFMCRIDTYYSTGPMVLEIAQIPLYFAGGYGLARLALRAGVTAIRAASVTGRVAATGTQLAARAGLVGLEAFDWAQVGADIQSACFPNEYTVGSTTGECSPENEIFQVYQEASIAQCLTSSVLGIAPMAGAGVSFFRSARYESKLLRRTTPDATPTPAPQTPVQPEEVIVVTGRRSVYVSARERDRVLGSLQRRTNLTEEQIQNLEFAPEDVRRLNRKERVTLIEEITAQRFSSREGQRILDLVETGNRGLDLSRFARRQQELRQILTRAGVPEDEVNALADRLLSSGALGRVPAATPGGSGLVIADAPAPGVRARATNVDVTSGNAAQTNAPALSRTPPSGTTVTPSGPRDPEEIIQSYTGSNHTLEDREIVIDIILGSPRKNEYLSNRDLSDPYRTRYAELEARISNDPNRARYADEIREFSDARVASGNQRAARELEELKRRNDVSEEDIDCAAMNRIYPNSFPDSGGVCKRVTFNEDVNGQYCACGNMSKTTFNWLVKCPGSVGDFRSLMGFADDLALPSGSLPDMCSRVDIPRGKECYMGSTSVTFAGFGGAVQLLCMDGGSGRMSDNARASVTENRLQIGNPRIQARRWSPFSDFPEYQAIVERAARSCPERCSPEELAQIERQFADATAAIRSRSTNPMDLQRLEREQQSFRDYFGDLRNGRLPTPALSRASRYTNEERVSQARRILRVDELTPRQQEAIQRAHVVGVSEGRGYFTFNQRDISEKARILREAGFNRDQIRRLMANGIVGGRSDEPLRIATGAATRADQLVQRSAQAARNRETYDVSELRRLRRESAGAYEVAAALDDNPTLIRASVEQYLRGGDVDGARRVLLLGERSGQSRQAQLRQLRQDLAAAEQRLQESATDAAIIMEVDARRSIVRALTPQVQRPVPSQSTEIRPAARTPADLSPRAARSEAERLRRANDFEGASTYFARAAERRTLNDRDFASAYEYSLRGNGTVVEAHLAELQSRAKVDELNAFLWEIHERDLYTSPDPTFKTNLNRVLKTVDQSKLFDPQRREIQRWIRNTEP